MKGRRSPNPSKVGPGRITSSTRPSPLTASSSKLPKTSLPQPPLSALAQEAPSLVFSDAGVNLVGPTYERVASPAKRQSTAGLASKLGQQTSAVNLSRVSRRNSKAHLDDTVTSVAKKKEATAHKLASQINIIEQLNATNVKQQNYEIEIERLQTTCAALQ